VPTWIGAALPMPFARAVFLAAIIFLLALGAAACWKSPRLRALWLAIAISAVLSILLLLPHLSALAPTGEQGRLFYTTSALLALLAALTVSARGFGSAGQAGRRVATLGACLVLIAAELVLLRATVAPWIAAGAGARALIAGLAAAADEIPAQGYGLVVAPDHLGSVPFARNGQGGLVLPPTQPRSLSSRLIVQTPADLAAWPADVQRGLTDALRRYPLAQVWPAVASGQAKGSAWPSDYFCWAARPSRLVRLGFDAGTDQANWLEAWRRALRQSPCTEAADELR
jgi:hypothetical protein